MRILTNFILAFVYILLKINNYYSNGINLILTYYRSTRYRLLLK